MNPVDELFTREEIVPGKYYRLEKLYSIMYDLGLIRMGRESFTRDWFSRKVQLEQIIMPPKPLKTHWQLTGKQIKDIVYTFAPGGTHHYDYRDYESPVKSRTFVTKKGDATP